MAATASQVRDLRAFNRTVTAAVGLLDEHLHDTAFSLSEARVLHELARRPATEVAELRSTLGLDSGYLSRLLASLEGRSLVERAPSERDGRRQVATLTAAGRDAFAELDRQADGAASRLLDAFGEPQRSRLVQAMRDVTGVLSGDGRPGAVVLRPAGSGDWGWIVSRNGAVYGQEFGWDETYEALVARIVADHVSDRDPRRETAWIAELDGRAAGCVLCVRDPEDDQAAKLRLLLVEPWARGAGIGRRLVEECIRFASRAGYARLVLWTNSPLTGARRIYDAAGFRLTGEEEHTSFGHTMTGQTLALDLG